MTAEQAAARKGPGFRRVEIVWMLLVVAALAGLTVLGWYARHGRIWLVNGLDVPVVVELDGNRRELGAGERTSAWVGLGVHQARVFALSGTLLDEDLLAIDESGGKAFHVYNVLGAAPLFIETIEYSSRSHSDRRETPIEFLGGRSFVSKERVDHLFEKPPTSLSVKQRGGSIFRTYADVAPGAWLTTVNYLAANDAVLAAAVAHDVSRAQPEDLTARAVAIQLAANAGGLVAAANLAEQYRDAAPKNHEAHRIHQMYRMRLGLGDELRAEYARWYAAGEKTPEAASLYARVLPPAEARAVLDEALGRHPDAPSLLLRKGMIATFEGNTAEAEALFARAATSAEYLYYADQHATALVALGRADEATALLARQLATKEKRFELALLHAQIARLSGGEAASVKEWQHVDEQSAEPTEIWRRTWARSALGDPSGVSSAASAGAKDPRGGEIDVVHLRAGENPATAWTACAALAPAAFRNLHATVAILLGAELARAGDLDMAEKLLGPRQELPFPWRAVVDYVTAGTEAPGFFRLAAEHRAALDFVRARALEAEGKPAEAHYEAAKRGDVLHSVVSRAIATWKPVKAPSAPAAVVPPQK